MKQLAWRMKRFALMLSIVWLTGCAVNDRPLPTLTLVPIDNMPLPSPTRSLERTPLERTPTLVVTHPIDTATPIPIGPTPSSTPVTRSQPTATATLLECPPLPAPTEVKTQAAAQHFEHGLMFWLQERDEIWALIASPQADQFYWRVLPNLWIEGQPESDPELQPLSERFQPVRGFGYAWRLGGGSYGPQRSDLGWALAEETGFDTTLIYYPVGYYSVDCIWIPKSGFYEFIDERGVVYRFGGAGGIARIVTSNRQ